MHLLYQKTAKNAVAIRFVNYSVDIMYNSGERMTTAKAIEITGRSRSFVVKMLHKLRDLEIITWFGSSKNDRNQYYLLVDK